MTTIRHPKVDTAQRKGKLIKRAISRTVAKTTQDE